MSTLKTEGIILHTLKFKDTDQIATLFTPHEGLLKFFIKRAYTPKFGKGTATALLSRAEFVYTKGKGDLYLCQEVTSLNTHPHLRANLPVLEASFDLLKGILRTQMPQRAAHPLYQLLQTTLERIHTLPDPWSAALSLRLKILRYEGVFHPTPFCSQCDNPLQEQYLHQGESFCRAHAPHRALEFSPDECALLDHLAHARHWSELAITLPPGYALKVIQLFDDHFS